jgi:Zn-dependent M28 family amino/carboxypeptidase
MLAAAAVPLVIAAPAAADAAGERWMGHVRVLADDSMEGRLTGTPGHDRAAAYVAQQFASLGLKPAGTDGFLQPVALVEQSLDLGASRLVLEAGGKRSPLALGEQLLPGTRVPQLKGRFSGELVFIGSGLHLPEAGHDDFAGLDLRGKVVVTLAGGPKRLSGALKAHARSAEFWPALERAGAIGAISIAIPNQMDVPWERQKLFAKTPGMRLADPALNDAKRPFFTATFSPAEAELLFAASGRSLAEMVELANRGEALPRFALNQRLEGEIATSERRFGSPNVVALLPGRDRRLAAEHVVLTAHLDHVGVDQPVNGDRIYNGAMDNASGISSMIESGRALARKRPKRSVLFVAVTGEERGLLGSRYFANRPTVAAGSLVANINMDMFLPLWPFTHVTALGAEESTLGMVSAEVARSVGATQVADDAPDRNLFVRSDQYSFVRTGVPALALKFAASTPEQQAVQKAWLTERYHAPSDDLSQPIEPAYAVAFNRYLERLIRAVADAPARPEWHAESFFARFSAPTSETGL